jgi:hypothetical protein
MDVSNVASYRPISNLPFVAKLTEKVIVQQLTCYLERVHALDIAQSAYRQFHSTETLLLKLKNDILLAMDDRKVTALVQLDLSAAFDTIDHPTLLNRLHHFGVRDQALQWIRDYLTNRVEQVKIGDVKSTVTHVTKGVPQGSVMGPLLFSLYVSPLGNLVRSHGLSLLAYADDMQLYYSFEPSVQSAALNKIEECCEAVSIWMSDNKLKLNSEKTEFAIFGTTKQLEKLSGCQLRVGTSIISPSSTVKSLGVILDSSLSMQNQVHAVCRSAMCHLRNLSRIRRHLTKDITETLVHAFISTRIDYCNSLLYNVTGVLLRKMQLLLNTAARIVSLTSKFSHITPVLIGLHWLPIEHRILYKIALFVYKCLNLKAPPYLSAAISQPKSLLSSRSLRSTSACVLQVHYVRTEAGNKSWFRAAPLEWNKLPEVVRKSTSIEVFKTNLKTFLFSEAYI